MGHNHLYIESQEAHNNLFLGVKVGEDKMQVF